MKRIHIIHRLLKQTGAHRLLVGYIAVFFACAVIIWVREPGIETLGDAIWYCYAVVTTIGFGDVLVTTHLSRIVSYILSIYSVMVIAIITGVVVNYYNQIVEMRQSETITAVLDRLEHLPDMPEEELEKLSETIRVMRRKR
jgi:voltage-gated potassium channel